MPLKCCNLLEVVKEMSISITLNVQLKKLNKTCLSEAYVTQTNKCVHFWTPPLMPLHWAPLVGT